MSPTSCTEFFSGSPSQERASNNKHIRLLPARLRNVHKDMDATAYNFLLLILKVHSISSSFMHAKPACNSSTYMYSKVHKGMHVAKSTIGLRMHMLVSHGDGTVDYVQGCSLDFPLELSHVPVPLSNEESNPVL